MPTRIVISPGMYVQGNGELSRIAKYAVKLGQSAFVIADSYVMKLTKDIVETSCNVNNLPVSFEIFKGECSKKEINRLVEICKQRSSDLLIGIGGGKALDTAKAVAHYVNIPVMIVPTIASTDAPCSALSVIYTESGKFEEYLVLPKNPSMVLMDTKIVAEAPARMLVAGMGDALATFFEARACLRSNSTTLAGAHPTLAAFELAKLCLETLLADGLKAKLAVESNVSNPALENIVEANTYLSGIGFESGGLAAAHAIHNGFTMIKESHPMFHGEKVAFGTIAQLVLENAPLEEIEEVISFCISVGLPVTLKDLGIKKLREDDIKKVAEAATVKEETIHNMPFQVTANDVFAAIITADKLGNLQKQG